LTLPIYDVMEKNYKTKVNKICHCQDKTKHKITIIRSHHGGWKKHEQSIEWKFNKKPNVKSNDITSSNLKLV